MKLRDFLDALDHEVWFEVVPQFVTDAEYGGKCWADGVMIGDPVYDFEKKGANSMFGWSADWIGEDSSIGRRLGPMLGWDVDYMRIASTPAGEPCISIFAYEPYEKEKEV